MTTKGRKMTATFGLALVALSSDCTRITTVISNRVL